jgi:hypothetical protein
MTAAKILTVLLGWDSTQSETKRQIQNHNNYLNKNYCVLIIDYLLISILFFLPLILFIKILGKENFGRSGEFLKNVGFEQKKKSLNHVIDCK